MQIICTSDNHASTTPHHCFLQAGYYKPFLLLTADYQFALCVSEFLSVYL